MGRFLAALLRDLASTSGLCLGILLGSCPDSGPAQERALEKQPAPGARPSRERPGGGSSRPPNREQWEKMTPQAREKLRSVYRRLEALPRPERERLLERLRMMPSDERRRAIEAAHERIRRGPPRVFPGPLSAATRKAPDPQVIRSLRRWSERLPPEVRSRVERFTRREQLEIMRAYRESELLLRVFPGRGEWEALLALTQKELRSLSAPEAAKPEGVSGGAWDRWRSLKPSVQKRLLRRLERLGEDAKKDPSGGAQK